MKWRTADGRHLEIRQMETDHLFNAVLWIDRHLTVFTSWYTSPDASLNRARSACGLPAVENKGNSVSQRFERFKRAMIRELNRRDVSVFLTV